MSAIMPMTRSERVYYAHLFGPRNRLRRDRGARFDGEKMVRYLNSKHMTEAARLTRRMRKVVSTERWH